LFSGRPVATHFCHSRSSKAASRPKPDFGTGELQSRSWRPQSNGQLQTVISFYQMFDCCEALEVLPILWRIKGLKLSNIFVAAFYLHNFSRGPVEEPPKVFVLS